MLTIIVRSVFQEDNKYYLKVFLDEILYELQMLEYDRTDISKGVDVNQKMHQESVIFVIIGIFQIKVLSKNHIFAMVVMI